ncbi:MAG: NAD(P)H-hydrate epimerase, partial [Elusimicrobia bacterium]|nr:NAD(P)H-hydrate epimerase [Elusimicrobiota bacterium]
MIVLKGSEVIATDWRTIAAGISGMTLMKRAAAGLGEFLKNLGAKKYVFVIGAGNNAGDGVYAAGILRRRQKKIFCIFPEKKINENVRRAAEETNQKIIFQPTLEEMEKSFREADCVVDCVFGTGFHGRVRGFAEKVIEKINESGKIVVSCDVPSGIDSNTGECFLAVKADFTITMGFPKLGLFLKPARNFAGSIRAVDIGLKKPATKPMVEMTTAEDIRKTLPVRNPDFHKYKSGHCLVFAGKMSGAAVLASMGVLRAGAGLLTIATDKKINFPEAIGIGYDTDIAGYVKRRKVKAVV